MSDLQPTERTFIAQYLVKLPFVEWDRFVIVEINDQTVVDVYGWIDREDSYKDFIWSRFWPESDHVEYTTSSDEYSEQIHDLWYPNESSDGHTECQRVENHFDIENAVEL